MEVISDIALESDNSGILDLVLDNGGFKLDADTLKTNLLVDLNTDSYIKNSDINNRRGSVATTYGNELWNYIEHSTFDEKTVQRVLNEVNEILEKYVDAGVWDSHSVEIYSQTRTALVLRIVAYKKLENQETSYFIKLKNTGM